MLTPTASFRIKDGTAVYLAAPVSPEYASAKGCPRATHALWSDNGPYPETLGILVPVTGRTVKVRAGVYGELALFTPWTEAYTTPAEPLKGYACSF